MNALSKLWQRVQLIVGHGTLRLSDDSKGLQRLQGDFLRGETRGELERFGQFGWTSRPPKGSELVALFYGGDRAHGIIISAEDRRVRPTGLEEGESMAYNAAGVRIHLKSDGSIEITAPGGALLTSPNLELSGDLKVKGSIDVDGNVSAAGVEDALGTMAEMRADYNLHTHLGVKAGDDASAPPLPVME